MATKKNADSGKAVKPAKQSPKKSDSKEVTPQMKAAIAASVNMSKPQYEKSEHAKVISYDLARESWSSKKGKTIALNPDHKAPETAEEKFIHDAVQSKDANAFNKLFEKHFKGMQIKHKATGHIITPKRIKPSAIDPNEPALEYQLEDTTGGVQIKKFFQHLEVVK